MTETAVPPGVGTRRRRSLRRRAVPLPPWLTRLLIVAGALGLWEWAARTERVDRLTVPPASSVFAGLDDIVTSDGFMMHVERTAFEIGMAFGFGLVGGILLGVVFWKSRAVSEALEPFLVTLYAMPTLVFYPILLALMGLNAGPIIVITVVFAIVPVAMNTMNALRSISPILLHLAASIGMSSRQRVLKIILPAATPIAVPGVKLGFIYAVVGTIAMEFILANRGIGYMINLTYGNFEVVDMFAYIVLVIAFAVASNSVMSAIERKIRRDML